MSSLRSSKRTTVANSDNDDADKDWDTAAAKRRRRTSAKTRLVSVSLLTLLHVVLLSLCLSLSMSVCYPAFIMDPCFFLQNSYFITFESLSCIAFVDPPFVKCAVVL